MEHKEVTTWVLVSIFILFLLFSLYKPDLNLKDISGKIAAENSLHSTNLVLRFDFDLPTGEIKNPQPIITINQKDGNPDGMTIDVNDCLWIALWGGSAVVCYDPKTAKLLHKIDLPVSQVSSCAFGGPKLNELYITCANVDLIKEEPLAGRLFKIKLDTKGLPTNSFSG